MYCGYLLWKWINNVAANVTQHVVHISTTHNEQNTHRTLTYLKHIIHHTFEHSQVLYRSVYKWYQYWQTDCVNAACSLYACARHGVRAFSPFMITGFLRDSNHIQYRHVCVSLESSQSQMSIMSYTTTCRCGPRSYPHRLFL